MNDDFSHLKPRGSKCCRWGFCRPFPVVSSVVGRRLRSELECMNDARLAGSCNFSSTSETISTASDAGMGGKDTILDLSDEGRFRRRERLTDCLALSTVPSSNSLINPLTKTRLGMLNEPQNSNLIHSKPLFVLNDGRGVRHQNKIRIAFQLSLNLSSQRK